MAQGFSLKDQLFNRAKIAGLGRDLAQAQSAFDAAAFEQRVMARLPDLELKARITWIADILDEMLPKDFDAAARIIENALPPPLDPTLRDDDFGDFIFAPYGEFAVKRGLENHCGRALDLIGTVTQRFSMEYAIRPFLNRWPDAVYDRLSAWARHPHYHVRRLVSEGTRPKLPWGIGIETEPERALALLDILHADQTRFVTRSVANHLNDISKTAPDLVLHRLAEWRKSGRQTAREMDWMTSHALRGLIKSGDARAMAMLGYDPDAPVTCALTIDTPKVAIGQAVCFTVTLQAASDTPVLVDWVLDFAPGAGRRGPKVFKLKQARIKAGAPLILTKSHRLKGDATTFRLTPGEHRISVQVNGRVMADATFALT